MNRLHRLAAQYKFDSKMTKEDIANSAFQSGFMAARKMCAVMAEIAHLEGKDIQKEVLKVGTELIVDPLPAA